MITSSVGFNLIDNKMLIKPLVQEFVKKENFLLNFLQSRLSTLSQTGPEVRYELLIIFFR